jgi:5-methylcytosine-specific restriction endonuclease McrA
MHPIAKRLQSDPVALAAYRVKESARVKQWDLDNPGKSYDRLKQWRKDNHERFLAYNRAHYQKDIIANRMKRRIQVLKRLAKKRSNGVGPVDVEVIIQRTNGKCHICGKKVSKRTMSLDHLIPIAQGGPTITANLGLSHLKCNMKRGNGRIPAQLVLLD